MAGAPPTMKGLLARLLLALAGTALGFALLEGGLTLYYAGLRPRGPLEIVESVGSPYVFRRRSDEGAEGNPYGIRPRRRQVEARPAPGVTRILSYGDSIGDGFKVKAEETYTHQLEELVSGTGRRFEILNMARGHSPTIYSFHIRHDVPELHPQGVILEIELVNDVSDEARALTAGRDADGMPEHLLRHRYILGWDGYILSPLPLRGSFLERTKLYAKLSAWIGRVRNKLDPNPVFAADSPVTYYSMTHDRHYLSEERLERGFDRLFESLHGIHGYLSRRDVRFLLVILPSIHVYRDDQYRSASRALVRRAEIRAEKLGIPFVSIHEEIGRAGGSDLFMDFCHPTAQGHRAIAAALSPHVATW